MNRIPDGPSGPAALTPERMRAARKPIELRRRQARAFHRTCLVFACSSVVLLALFLAAIMVQGWDRLSLDLLRLPPSPDVDRAGMLPAIAGTVWLLVLVALFALPLGVATAVLLEEFRPRSRSLRRALDVVQANITNLAGVPSVVYGIVGLTAFVALFHVCGSQANPGFEWGVRYYDQFYNEADQVLLVPAGGPAAPAPVPAEGLSALTADLDPVRLHVIGDDAPWPADPELARRTVRAGAQSGRIQEHRWYYVRLPLGRGVLAGALTLMLVILPVVIISSQESLRAVPGSLREAALGLGATRWQVVREVTLPAALPGILTGAILAMSRAIGEAAPILMIAGIVFISNPPGNLMDDFTAMPLQIFNWAQRPQQEFHDLAASGIVVLLVVLLCFNGVAALVRHKLDRPLT